MSSLIDKLHAAASDLYLQTKAGLVWGPSRRTHFYNMAAGFIEDGMPIFDVIQALEERWKDQKDARAPYLTGMLAAMRGAKNGKAMRVGEAMGAWAPSLEAMAIDGGEQVGEPAEGFRMAARLANTQTQIKTTVNGEMLYPTFLVGLFIVALIAIDSLVLPVFSSIAPRELWPKSAHYMGMLASNAYLITGLIVGSIISLLGIFFSTRNSWTGQVRDVFDAWIPPWTIHRRITGAILMSSFANFIKAGIPFSSVLDRLSATASDWEKYHLSAMRNKMRRGLRDGDAMAGPLFDEDIKWEISIYGRMTTFNQALVSLAERTTSRTLERIKQTAGILRFLIMFMVAGMIVWVYASFFEITMVTRSSTGY